MNQDLQDEKYFPMSWDLYHDRATWLSESRKRLNAIVDAVNQWTVDYKPDGERPRLLRMIQCGLVSFSVPGENPGICRQLEEMRAYVCPS